jgi:simple sugar transport system permease protein
LKKKSLIQILYEYQTLINVLIALVAAFIIGTLVIMFLGYSPAVAYTEMIRGAFSGKFNFGGTIERFVPLLLSGLAFIIAAKVSFFNIGVEGQLYFGAITAAFLGVYITGLPAILHIPIVLMGAAIAGGVWALIPGFLNAKFNVNEVCLTIMLNYVAIQFTSYIVNHPFKNPNVGIPQTPNLQDSAMLPKIMFPSRANIGLFIALAVLIFFIWLFSKTTVGYKIKSVGNNPFFSEYIGMKSKVVVVMTVIMSGMVGGLIGGIQITGIHGYFIDQFSPGYGFDGIMIGFLSRNNLKALPFVAFFIAVLRSGSIGMERFTGIPKEVVGIIEALIILFAAAKIIIDIKKSSVTSQNSSDEEVMEVG